MSSQLQIREICERALRKVGAYAIRSTGARPEEMNETLYWLDMVISHVAARQRAWWLVPTTIDLPLTPGVASYNLSAASFAVAPDGVQNVVEITLYDADVDRDIDTPLLLMRRSEWEAIEDKDRQATPEAAYIDRTNNPTMLLYPVPPPDRNLVAQIVLQRFTTNLLNKSKQSKIPEIRKTWNLYLVTAVAAQIANGPVRKLPADEVKDMKEEARALLMDLEAYDSHEQASEPRQVRYNNGI